MSSPPCTALTPRDLGLILTYRCLPTCAHCLYNCGPSWQDWMTVDQVTTALENARSLWAKGFQVHLTGGEPFMNFPLLLAATRIAVDLGIPVYAETNAGWCRHPQVGLDRFRQLREAGMGTVLISVSPFHHETIPLNRTLAAIQAAQETFGPHRTLVYQSEWLPEMAHHGLSEPVLLETYLDEYDKDQAGLRLWLGYGLISGGRAGYRLGHLAPKQPAIAFQGMRCMDELLYAQHSHLDLYGNFIPSFCGGISMGDWHSLTDVVADIRQGSHPPLVRILLEGGPYGLYHAARQANGYTDLEGGYAGKCHLCVDVRRHLITVGLHANNLQPARFYESF